MPLVGIYRQSGRLEEALFKSGLPDNAQQRSSHYGIMKRYRNRNRSLWEAFLHDPVAASLASQHKIVLFENPAHFQA